MKFWLAWKASKLKKTTDPLGRPTVAIESADGEGETVRYFDPETSLFRGSSYTAIEQPGLELGSHEAMMIEETTYQQNMVQPPAGVEVQEINPTGCCGG